MLWKSLVETKLYQPMIENLPIAVVICDIRDFRVTYMNEASRSTL